MRSISVILFLALLATGCGISCHEPVDDCAFSTFVVEGCCSGTTVYEIELSTPIGDTLSFTHHGGLVTLHNAVQVAGKHTGDKNVKLRPFNPDTDGDLIATNCWCIQAEPWAVLPLYVIVEDCNTTLQE